LHFILKTTFESWIELFLREKDIFWRRFDRQLKLRNIYFRLIHNDFFTGVRMEKYRMTKDDECPRYNVYM
jgi:hypothetical protein